MVPRTLVIPARFNGPANSGNGGYVCGVLAREINGPSEITLRSPPPLETPLTLSAAGAGVRLVHGETTVAEAQPISFDLAPPPFPGIPAAEAARARYRGLLNHRYPTCFVCGAGRPNKDGLDLFTGALGEGDVVASTWTPGPDLGGGDGHIAPEFIHAALDCPSYWSLPRAGEMAALLARLRARVDGEAPRIGETCVVCAWPIQSDGRKHRGGAVLYGSDGRLIARTEALWIEPRAE